MAKFKMELPSEIMKDFQKIYDNADEIFGEMTRAGAEVVMNNVKASVPLTSMSGHVKLSKTYKTPSDDGINTKVYFSGYLPFKGNRKTFKRRGRSGGSVHNKRYSRRFFSSDLRIWKVYQSFSQKTFFSQVI